MSVFYHNTNTRMMTVQYPIRRKVRDDVLTLMTGSHRHTCHHLQRLQLTTNCLRLHNCLLSVLHKLFSTQFQHLTG